VRSDVRIIPMVLAVAACRAEVDPVDYSHFPLAYGAHLDKVTWLQGVERTLHLGENQFGTGSRPPPIIVGREAVLRVHVSAEEAFEGDEVAAVVQYGYGPMRSTLSEMVNLGEEWTQSDLGTTAVFHVPAYAVVEDMDLTVSLHDPYLGYREPIEAEPPLWRSTEEPAPVPSAVTDSITLVIIPVKYVADGSGRLPDTSPAAIDLIADALYAMYPASRVEVEIAEPLTWANPISAFGGWEALLGAISNLRGAADVPENTYYYGLFNPKATFEEHCGGGCTLGLSNLAFGLTDSFARSSIGIGYVEQAAETLVHEVGHAHGRLHSPCGGAAGTDPLFPYPNARLGSWGFDLVHDAMVDPNAAADIMSYCTPMWVSDYTFNALLERIRLLSDEGEVGTLARTVPKIEWQLASFDASGIGTIHGVVRARPEPGGDPVEIELLDAAGGVIEVVEGRLVPFDHLEGGTGLVPFSRWRAPVDRMRLR
jgi:hypothetical protein